MSAADQASPYPYFGRYRLVQRLATGGMAQLHLAALDGPGGFSKICVVKTMLPELSSNADFSRMFITEAKVAALLSHPNIVQVHDFGKVGDQYYLALEYVEGRSLHELFQAAARARVELGPMVALAVGAALCDAMTSIHELRAPDGTPLDLVHRDLSPGNVLISTRGVVKLTDFGVVKVGSAREHTAVGVIKGKFDYMSPEQIHATPIDHRSDLFSLGIVLYEAATQRRLFRRSTVAETVLAVGSATVPPPRTFAPDFPEDLERVLLKALALAPDDRYQSFSELSADLEEVRAKHDWAARPSTLAGLVNALWAPAPPSFERALATGRSSGMAEARVVAPELEVESVNRTNVESVSRTKVEPPRAPWGAVELALGAMGLALLGLITWLLIE